MRSWTYKKGWNSLTEQDTYFLEVSYVVWWVLFLDEVVQLLTYGICSKIPSIPIPDFPVWNKYDKVWTRAHDYCASNLRQLWCWLVCHSELPNVTYSLRDKYSKCVVIQLDDNQVASLLAQDPAFRKFYDDLEGDVDEGMSG